MSSNGLTQFFGMSSFQCVKNLGMLVDKSLSVRIEDFNMFTALSRESGLMRLCQFLDALGVLI